MKNIFSKIDIQLLIMIIIYCAFGLIMVYSASGVTAVSRYGYSASHYFIRQAIFMGVSLLTGFIIILRMPLKSYNALAFPLVLVIILTLIYLLINGRMTNNAVSWLDFKYIKLQPSEFAKSIIIIFMAVYYNILGKRKKSKSYLQVLPLGIVLLITGLIFLQHDLGTAVIFAVIGFLIFFSIPYISKKIKGIVFSTCLALVTLVVVLVLAGVPILSESQKNRLNFLNPCSRYTEETGYQVCNGYIAINNGGLFGVGLGNSTQKYLYLPEAHTDFIFPIIVEELGLFTGILVVIGYIYMLIRILKIAKNAYNLRDSILAYGTFCYLASHIFINLLGVLGLIPLTGVPLPLLSYGGSFTVNCIIMLFITLKVSMENKDNKIKSDIRAL